jgi:collagenase-like PrtC family protease
MKNHVSFLTIPCHWDIPIIDAIISGGKCTDTAIVREVYGVLAEGGPIGHGRSSNAVVSVDKNYAVQFRQYLREKGLRFVYLLNAPFIINTDIQQRMALEKYISWVLQDIKPDALMISSYELMRYVRSFSREIPIYISTIAGVKKPDDVKKVIDISPARVVPHHDLGRDWKALVTLTAFCNKEGIEIEIMATESCLFGCPKRQEHYEYLAGRTKDAPFHTECNSRKLTHPREFLLSGGVIRPEDVHIYEDIGIKYFKITGRSKPAKWLPEVVRAYQSRMYHGNLIRLLGIDPSLRAEEWIYISNEALSGFLEEMLEKENVEEREQYADSLMIRLYKKGEFRLLDGSKYRIEGGSISLVEMGKKAKSVLEPKFA